MFSLNSSLPHEIDLPPVPDLLARAFDRGYRQRTRNPEPLRECVDLRSRVCQALLVRRRVPANHFLDRLDHDPRESLIERPFESIRDRLDSRPTIRNDT